MIAIAYTIVAAILLVGGLAGCSEPNSPAPAVAPSQSVAGRDARRTDYWDVVEAVYRYQFNHNASAAKRKVEYFFLLLEEKDPPESLLARFKAETPRVVPASLATSTGGGHNEHRKTGGRGLKFYIKSVKWLDADTAEVTGGYHEANLSASGNVYRVERRDDGKWVVSKDKRQWIS